MESTAPSGPGSLLGTVGVDGIPVVLTETSVEIDLVNSEPSGSLPDVANQPEEEDDRDGKA